MSETKIGNDPAFPADAKTQTHGGMTIREYFAIKAMQGILSANPTYSQLNLDISDVRVLTGISIQYADALIEELHKKATA